MSSLLQEGGGHSEFVSDDDDDFKKVPSKFRKGNGSGGGEGKRGGGGDQKSRNKADTDQLPTGKPKNVVFTDGMEKEGVSRRVQVEKKLLKEGEEEFSSTHIASTSIEIDNNSGGPLRGKSRAAVKDKGFQTEKVPERKTGKGVAALIKGAAEGMDGNKQVNLGTNKNMPIKDASFLKKPQVVAGNVSCVKKIKKKTIKQSISSKKTNPIHDRKVEIDGERKVTKQENVIEAKRGDGNGKKRKDLSDEEYNTNKEKNLLRKKKIKKDHFISEPFSPSIKEDTNETVLTVMTTSITDAPKEQKSRRQQKKPNKGNAGRQSLKKDEKSPMTSVMSNTATEVLVTDAVNENDDGQHVHEKVMAEKNVSLKRKTEKICTTSTISAAAMLQTEQNESLFILQSAASNSDHKKEGHIHQQTEQQKQQQPNSEKNMNSSKTTGNNSPLSSSRRSRSVEESRDVAQALVRSVLQRFNAGVYKDTSFTSHLDNDSTSLVILSSSPSSVVEATTKSAANILPDDINKSKKKKYEEPSSSSRPQQNQNQQRILSPSSSPSALDSITSFSSWESAIKKIVQEEQQYIGIDTELMESIILEMSENINPNLTWDSTAIKAIHRVAERYIRILFEDAYKHAVDSIIIDSHHLKTVMQERKSDTNEETASYSYYFSDTNEKESISSDCDKNLEMGKNEEKISTTQDKSEEKNEAMVVVISDSDVSVIGAFDDEDEYDVGDEEQEIFPRDKNCCIEEGELEEIIVEDGGDAEEMIIDEKVEKDYENLYCNKENTTESSIEGNSKSLEEDNEKSEGEYDHIESGEDHEDMSSGMHAFLDGALNTQTSFNEDILFQDSEDYIQE